MANPRQRRKLRSGSYKPIRHSRRAQKNLKKQPPIRGPKVLQDAWDRHKTVRQNYEALGLVASLNPSASGGVERPMGSSRTNEQPLMDVDTEPVASTSSAAGHSELPKGFGRIIRDEDGNVLDVELAEDDSDDIAQSEDRLVEDVPEPSQQEELAGWVALGSSTAASVPVSSTSSTHVVQSEARIDVNQAPLLMLHGNSTARDRDDLGLEAFAAARGGSTPRFASGGERTELRRLVAKYGEDVEGMARDRKLNPSQRTAGQLSRAVKKAGGFAELRTR